MEPSYPLINILIVVPPFAAYFVGILIRHEVWGSEFSLRRQLLIGIPMSLGVVGTLLMTVMPNVLSSIPGYLMALGLVMEQGMVVNEHAIAKLKSLKEQALPAVGMANNQTTAV